eukprot:EG_transcript_4380
MVGLPLLCCDRASLQTLDQPNLPHAFESRHRGHARRAALLWSGTQALLHAALLALACPEFGGRYGAWSVPLGHLPPLAVALGLAGGVGLSRRCAPHVVLLWWAACVLNVGFAGLTLATMAQALLTHVLCPAVDSSPVCQALATQAHLRCAGTALLTALLTVGPTGPLAYRPWTLSLHLSPLVAFAPALCAIFPRQADLTVPVLLCGVVCTITLVTSLHHLRTIRRSFALEHLVVGALAAEQAALQQALAEEQAQRCAAEKAEGILNHLLKNLMADGLGCIELALNAEASAAAGHLQRACETLRRGMSWCKQRHVLGQLAAGQYAAAPTPIDFPELCAAVVGRRTVATTVPPAVVWADPTLCSIVLENALSNAFRHGHPTDPQVTCAVHLLPADPPAGPRRRLLLRLTNRANPARPTVTDTFLAQLAAGLVPPTPRGTAPSALSDRIGLEHMAMAAGAHGMDVSLKQVDDLVVFTASLEVQVEALFPSPSHENCSSAPASPLLKGLRIQCLDDSPVSRKLVAFNFAHHAQADVHTFGTGAVDVEAFLQAATADADVVIMDQHLEFGDLRFLGTDLIGVLLRRGYRGLVCVRSADDGAEAQLRFRRSGAHCVLSKALSGPEMVALVAAAHQRLVQSRGGPTRTVATPLLPYCLTFPSGDPEDELPTTIGGSPLLLPVTPNHIVSDALCDCAQCAVDGSLPGTVISDRPLHTPAKRAAFTTLGPCP